MTMSTDRRASVKLAALFIVLAGIPLVALGWLGGRLLEQDRTLENQRRRDRLENAATILTRELDRSLAAWDARLPSAAQGTAVELPPSGVLLIFDSSGVVQHQGVRLPFYPRVPPAPAVPGDLFAAGEVQEFQLDDFGSARRRPTATSPQPTMGRCGPPRSRDWRAPAVSKDGSPPRWRSTRSSPRWARRR